MCPDTHMLANALAIVSGFSAIALGLAIIVRG